MDMKEAPTLTSSGEKMKNDIKNECQEILNKYFEGREYDKEKFIKYKNYCLDEVINYLDKNYKDFGFVITFISIKVGNLRNK